MSELEELREKSLEFIRQWKPVPIIADPFDGIVQYNGKRTIATSLEVAKRFEKAHKNVMRDIRNLLSNLQQIKSVSPSEDVFDSRITRLNGLKIERVKQGQIDLILDSRGEPYFELASYVDEKGEQRSIYNMSRDGFSLLVMGFTGIEAIKWKLKFIEAYNLLEDYFTIKSYCICHTSELLRTFLGARRSVGASEIETYYFDPVQVDRKRRISLAVCDLGDSAFLRFFWKEINIWNERLPVNIREIYDELDGYWIDQGCEEMLGDFPDD